ncbi:amino acid ABC transporter permease [Skermania sp. ID1734]|uniref:amino acid ABC transporter permease n=1 Tax=Skermania sp. ID1734 TaxID=2597516 RepID=UPI00117E1217|nr:amino acid ABC transporter permease [Skermania sp. ID1734]TSD96128.1 amino acid ABC transporter permease [Skermania sp. ID1734]
MRNQVISVVVAALLGLAAWQTFIALDEKGQLTAAKWDPFGEATSWTTFLLPGIEGTVLAAAISVVLAVILGATLGIGRLSEHRVLRWSCGCVVELFRAIPVLILMIFAYQVFAEYNVFRSRDLALAAVITGLTLYNGSVIAVILRAGIRSLPSGQSEAARALGMRKAMIMRSILLPQAITAMLPAVVSQMVVVLKDSALGYLIGYVEVVRSGQQLGAFYGNYLPALVVVALIMIVLNSTLSWLATTLERRLRSGRRRKGQAPVVSPATDRVTIEAPVLR